MENGPSFHWYTDKICQEPARKAQAEHLVSFSHERLPLHQVPKLRAQAALVGALQDATISVMNVIMRESLPSLQSYLSFLSFSSG